MFYHAVVINNMTNEDSCAYAVIRTADAGITDIEWEHGCRAYPTITQSTEALKSLIKYQYTLVSEDHWNRLISSMDDPSNVTDNNFISTIIKEDKWLRR